MLAADNDLQSHGFHRFFFYSALGLLRRNPFACLNTYVRDVSWDEHTVGISSSNAPLLPVVVSELPLLKELMGNFKLGVAQGKTLRLTSL